MEVFHCNRVRITRLEATSIIGKPHTSTFSGAVSFLCIRGFLENLSEYIGSHLVISVFLIY